MSLFEELIEDKETDEKIVKSFEPKDHLTEQIFSDDTLMREDVQKALLKISNEFIDFLGIDFFIHDVVLTGSLANYNWSEFSDVDLHIIIDFEDTKYERDILKEFFDAKKNIWNEKHKIKIKGYDVELYVQYVSEEHVSSGVYSVLHNKWIVEPEKTTPNIDDRKILEKGEQYAKKIDKLITNSKSKDILKQIDTLRKKIKEFRQCGLENGGEFSYENLTFKLLRRNGYIEKLLNLKNKVPNTKLSIAQ